MLRRATFLLCPRTRRTGSARSTEHSYSCHCTCRVQFPGNRRLLMKYVGVFAAAVFAFFTVVMQGQQPSSGNLEWAYPLPDKNPPKGTDDGKTPKRITGSTRSYTQAQIDDQFNPPDWFPEEHGPLPKVVQTGIQAQACGSCHLMSGHGHPESAT